MYSLIKKIIISMTNNFNLNEIKKAPMIYVNASHKARHCDLL